MGSFKRSGRNQGPERRAKALEKQRRGLLYFETLESRTLLATSAGVWKATDTNLADVTNGPMANEGQTLIGVYQAFLNNTSAAQIAAQFPMLQFNGDMVAIQVNGSGNVNTFAAALTNLGVQVSQTSAEYGLVVGYAPISRLPEIAQLPQTLDASPNYKPQFSFQGEADNEGQHALEADLATAQYNVTGKGVTIGVLSDSVSQFGNGLADSVATGDLPNNVDVLQDGQPGDTDEGRAILENIYDIAPGASLAFATADGGDLGTATNIQALANIGANLLVDDVGFADEPFFQDGIVSQAVDAVVASGHTYFSAAGNTANDGYLSDFRGSALTAVTAPGGLGAGTYMNFAPSGAAVTQLPITVGGTASAANPAELLFQFDQPFATQEPAGSTAAPTSEVDFYVLDSTGAVVASGNTNNVATRSPEQIVTVNNPGNYTVVIKVVSGTNPNHVEFVNFNENVDVTVSSQFGTGPGAGDTYYPSTYGHSAAAATIGVGAVPWWATSASGYLNQIPLQSEPFSAFGPTVVDLSPTGTPLTGNTLLQSPVVSGTDGGNTSFFTPGQTIDTSQPPFPGEPATATNLAQPNLPTFFGTSSAAPNVTAVAALMLQKKPGLTPAQIRAGLIASTEPLDGAAPKAWSPQGGFGLVNAVAAINSIQGLTVSATTPANGSTLGATPSSITVTFSEPVNFATVTAADLSFTTLPPGVTSITVGTPIAIGSPIFPTQVQFPITYNLAPNQSANGNYAFTVHGPVVGQDGTTLTAFTGAYVLNDVTPPHVIGTSINGRVISIQFDKPIAQNTLNNNTAFVALTNSTGGILQNLDNDARFKMTYNAATNTVNLDYSGLDQTELPSGYYKIVVRAGDELANGTFEPGVTDLAGNKLDGTFYGTFPTAYNPALSGPLTPFTDHNFAQFLGFLSIKAPVISSLSLQAASDTGIPGDQNTNDNTPTFIGQVSESFPGTVAGVTIEAEFSGLHGGVINLVSQNGRGSSGTIDVQVTTDANGAFTLPGTTPIFLPEGYQRVQVVAVNQPDSPPLPGLSSSNVDAFRIDQTSPTIVSATLSPATPVATNSLPLGATFTPVASLSTLSLDVTDPASPSGGPLATPPSVNFPAVNPTSATNISNYTLKNLDLPIGQQDLSSFITAATFVPTDSTYANAPNRTLSSQAYYGRIDLTFAPGLPAGHYQFIVHTPGGSFLGLTDAAGNPLTETSVPAEGTNNFYVSFDIQPAPVFIQSVSTNEANAQGNTLLPYSYYEINPRAGDIVSAPPTTFNIDFSNPLNPNTINNDSVQLIGTADTPGGTADGDFGTFGEGGLGSTGTGFSRFDPLGTTVTLTNGPSGPNTRLVLQLPAGTVLPADHYRLYIPNTGTEAISDIFGNQLDGEFLGDPSSSPSVDANDNPIYEDLQPDGQYRQDDMSGDGTPGGAFTAGFEVVNTGNLIYARPDYTEDPLLPSTEPDGTVAKPYEVLAPQASADAANSSTLNNGDPNGGLNDLINFTNFNPADDKADLGEFARSAFYAASQLADNGPVVIVALPGAIQRDPTTGQVSQKTFVLQAPIGGDGSASVPFDTTLVFAPGSTLKLQNASLFVQNQGSALQTLGGSVAGSQVTFTSVNDNFGNTTNPNGPGGDSTPRPGDWGGIVFRNFDDAIAGRTDTFPVDGTLIGADGDAAVSGADDSLSEISFTNIRYAGGAVPATQGQSFDAIQLYNSRPAIVQDSISFTGNGSQAGATGTSATSGASISADLDSFREDDTRRGPLIRQDSVVLNSLNGILIRPDLSGAVETSDAEIYPDNPITLGGQQNYTFDAPLPYLLIDRMEIGTEVLSDTNDETTTVTNRIYVQPGVMFKFQRGAGIEVTTPGASINIGDRTYINGFDSSATETFGGGGGGGGGGFGNALPTSPYGPVDDNGVANPNFKPEPEDDAFVVFTSLYDNTATTSFTDPVTGLVTTIVPAIDSANTGPVDPLQPVAGNVPALARWGSLTIDSGAIGVIDSATIEYGGGAFNTAGGTITRNVLSLLGGAATISRTLNPVTDQFVTTSTPGDGARVMITNNNFFDNTGAPIAIDPNGLLAADPLHPLASGAPFFRNNVLLRNSMNGLLVLTSPLGEGGSNLSNNSVWNLTDITYILTGTIVPDDPAARAQFQNPGGGGTTVQAGATPPVLGPIPTPSIVLTIESQLGGTLLANGQTIPSPGQSVVVKLDGTGTGDPVAGQGASVAASDQGGAGFLFGVDNGVDPPGDVSVVDQGYQSQLRILGIGGNQTTGQVQVPAIITSIHDSTVGPTVRGVAQNQVIPGDVQAPAAGDGGVIDFGANSLTTYNAFDVREGNKIDNAVIKYITRIEMQGGGDIAGPPSVNTLPGQPPAPLFNASLDELKAGVLPNLANGVPDPDDGYIQGNDPKELTVSDSSFSNFSQVGILEQPGFVNIQDGVRNLAGDEGEPNELFVYNTTFSNMPVGIRTVGQQDDNSFATDPTELLVLNDDFVNTALGVDLIAPTYNTLNSNAFIQFVAMDSIFDGNSTAAIQDTGQNAGSEAEYNLFFNDATFPTGADPNNPVNDLSPGFQSGIRGFNFQPVYADPMFVNTASGNYELEPTSAAIDAGRSELDVSDVTNGGNELTTLITTDNQLLNALGGIRNTNNRIPNNANNLFGGGGPGGGGGVVNQPIPSDELTLPGYGPSQPSLRGYVDEWTAVLPSNPNAVQGPASNADTFDYAPISGVRDAVGNLRVKSSVSSNVGSGSRPYFDIGAFEFVQTFPPHVTAVTATVTNPLSPTGTSQVNLYQAGGFAGTNEAIQSIQVQFDGPINPTTITNQTVLLEASGGTGVFTTPTILNLSGKLSYNATTHVLTINVGAAGLLLTNDEYRLILEGNGSNVIASPQGTALDGQNVANDNPANPQLPLPSGSGAPGTNFFDTFLINNAAPSVAPFTFEMSPTSVTSTILSDVTKNNFPSFQGTVSVPLPKLESLAGLTVILDISTKGDGVFDRLDAGTAVTNGAGNFVVTVGQDGANTGLVTNTSPLPDSFYNVGADGILGTADDFGYTWARVRVIDPEGNSSNAVTDTPAQYAANNALSGGVIDTSPPTITSFSPTPNTVVTPVNGTVTFTFTVNKNLNPNSVNPNSILVFRAGPSGVLGAADQIAVPVNPGSIVTKYLGGSRLGPEQITFTVSGTTNDLYGVILKGTGASPITDDAGNALGGGVDFNPSFIVQPTTQTLIYVEAPAVGVVPVAGAPPVLGNLGSFENPYPTIGAAMAAAFAGDTIAVLPGVYTENVVMKAFVKLVSADPSSSDTTLVPGNALDTIIRGAEPAVGAGGVITTTGANVTVTAANLPFIPGADTEVSGFSIASPLLGTLTGNGAAGPIDPTTIGVQITNANLLLTDDYIMDANIGVNIVASAGVAVLMPRIESDVIAGNNMGIEIDDLGATAVPNPAAIYNDDLAFNTIGLFDNDTATSPMLANVANDIFFANHDQTTAENGFGIFENSPNNMVVRNSLFQSNGSSSTTAKFAGMNVSTGFNPGPTPDGLDNYTGNPAFVSPIDPRPGSDGPAAFFLDADYDLQSTSAAIDTADNVLAPPTDFLGRGRVKIAGHGFPGTGPADVGAFEFDGTNGTTVGGAFRVATTSISATGAPVTNGTVVFTPQTAPKAITVTFSANVNVKSIVASDLVIYGQGVAPVGGVQAHSITVVNAHTVTFNLSGNYSSQGSVYIKFNPGALTSAANAPLQGYADYFRISSTTTSVSTPTPAPSPTTPVVVSIPTTPKAPVGSTTTKKTAQTALLAAAKAVTPVPAPSPTTPSGPLFKAKKK